MRDTELFRWPLTTAADAIGAGTLSAGALTLAYGCLALLPELIRALPESVHNALMRWVPGGDALAVQVGTGLCANDDGDTYGPLADNVGKHRSDWLSHIHAVNFTLHLDLAGHRSWIFKTLRAQEWHRD